MFGINRIGFNQDKSCFYVCLNDGLRIFNVIPLVQETFFDQTSLGSVGCCEMVYRCNLFAIVGGGNQPKYAANAVLIYDDIRKLPVMEFTFAQPVLSVKCRRDRLVAVLKNKVHIFTFPNNPQKLFTVETHSNPLGLCELSPGIHNLAVFPGLQIGTFGILDLSPTAASTNSRTPLIIKAHQGEIACLSINQSGSMIATASDKGTLIRVFDSLKLVLLNELRLGFVPATLYSINFSMDSDFLCCSIDGGTIHVFDIKESQLNGPSSVSSWNFFGKYAESMWALANFTVTPSPGRASICAFASSNSVVVLCMDGTIHKYAFTSEGQCSRLTFDVFLDVCDSDDF